MSDSELIFELSYQIRNGRGVPNLADLRRFFKELPDVVPDGNSSWRYFNGETQVSCDFVAYEPRAGEAGISFEMGLPRARFFALECLPMAVALAREFDLGVELISPELELPDQELTFELLLEVWEQANQDEVAQLEQDGLQLASLDRQALELLWEFQLLRNDMARRYHREGIQVPPVWLWEEKETGKIVRVAEWRGLTSAGLGDCDYYLLENSPDSVPSGVLVATREFPEKARFAYRDLAQPVYHRLFDKARTRAELIEAVAAMEKIDPSGFRVIPWGELVDNQVRGKV